MPENKKKKLKKQLINLSKDQFYPSLKTKKNFMLSKMYNRKVYESRIDQEYRFIWFYDGKNIILLLSAGNHDIVERLN